jgi:hypothetical protein
LLLAIVDDLGSCEFGAYFQNRKIDKASKVKTPLQIPLQLHIQQRREMTYKMQTFSYSKISYYKYNKGGK